MRPVVLQLGVTLDAFVHGVEGYEDWGLPPEDDELVEWKAQSLRQAGTHIMGRTTYEAMASVWPKSTGMIHPVAIGHGTGLFASLPQPFRLDLVDARTFPSGTVAHTYRPHEAGR